MHLSVAHLTGVAALQLALLLLIVDVRLAALPLLVVLLLWLVAPFLPGFGFFLPVVSRGSRRLAKVALSFDDGPDPAVTPQVLDLLDRTGVKAAFFLVGAKAKAHPEVVREILARGHEVGNHSMHHDPLLMLKGRRAIREEVARAQEVFLEFGIQPRAFRPPVGIMAPPLGKSLLDHGMFCMNFSLRGWDAGNRRIQRLADRLLRKVRPGDLLLLHDVTPAHAPVACFLTELESLIQGLRSQGLDIVAPSRLVGRAVMRPAGRPMGAAERFYDDLADSYDEEQFQSGVSRSRTLELQLFRARLPQLLQGRGKVLEIGAGTGIFSLELARHCEEVDALDVSANMLGILEQKARREGVSNVRTTVGDAEQVAFKGPYALVCAFSALEYIQDLPALFLRLAPHMEPGAKVYLVTARTSFLRFFIQIGNALRQGIWLTARTRREMETLLRAAGVTGIRTEGHLFKGLFSGGMLLEVEGQWPSRAEEH